MVMGAPIDSYASGRIGKLFQKTNRLLSRSKNLQDTVYTGKILNILSIHRVCSMQLDLKSSIQWVGLKAKNNFYLT